MNGSEDEYHRSTEAAEPGVGTLDDADDASGARMPFRAHLRENIRSGDLLLLVREAWSGINDIVLAVHQSEAGVKRLPQEEGPFVLQPSNRACEAMQVDDETATEDKVIGAVQTPE